MSYCDFAPQAEFHREYHEREYGFPVTSDRQLFERLVLEINQAGLSWLTILKKRDGFRDAYHQFEIDRVAAYDQRERERLLADPRIIRNRLKVNAAIVNAGRIRDLRKRQGTFAGWIEAHHPLSRKEWTTLFRKTFIFTGGEITTSFLMSIGYLGGAHDERCPVYGKIARLAPPWMRGISPRD